MVRSHPIGVFADEECDRGDSRRNHAAPVLAAVLVGSRRFESRRMRRQAAPSDRACQAQLIEVRGIVIGDSARQHKPLPRAGGNLKPLQLADDFERAMLTPHLRTGSDVLPAQQPVHELRRGDRRDLLAQRRDGQPMNASQQTALAPLGFVSLAWPSGCAGREFVRTELAAQNRSAGLHAQQSLFNLSRRQAEQFANFRRGGRAKMRASILAPQSARHRQATVRGGGWLLPAPGRESPVATGCIARNHSTRSAATQYFFPQLPRRTRDSHVAGARRMSSPVAQLSFELRLPES